MRSVGNGSDQRPRLISQNDRISLRATHIESLSVTFGCKDAGAILQSLTDDACKAANENAERLSGGFRKKLAGVRAISENGFSGIGTAFGFTGEVNQSYGTMLSRENRDFRVIPSTISFQKGIYAIFAIE